MPRSNHSRQILICSLIIASAPLFGGVKLDIREGRPVVDGVYVNGHGPYRLLVDTGSNINLIETGLARKIGMNATFQVNLASSSGKIALGGSDGNEIELDSAKAGGQKILFSGLEAIHNRVPDVQGVLGQWFLIRFDYVLDLRGKRIEFGVPQQSGTRAPYKMVNARPVVATSLGDLALDSGSAGLILFGVQPGNDPSFRAELRTLAGSQQVGRAFKTLVIANRKFWEGEAAVLPNRPEPGVDGLLPLALFKSIYFCNSEGYVIFE
jgi:hypothetical protein